MAHHDVYYEAGSYKLTFYDATDTKVSSMKVEQPVTLVTALAEREMQANPTYHSYTIERMIVNTLQTPWSKINAATK